MHRKLIIALVLLLATHCVAQPNWARRLGAWSNDAWNGLVTDALGNSYVVGEFGGTIALPGNTLQSNGSLDVMLAKYGPAGDLIWIRTFGGPALDRGAAVALGPNGELAITGQFMGTVQFGTQTLVTQGGTQDVFVLRLSPVDGSVLWARQGGSADGVDQPNGISVGPDGDVVVTGEFRGTAVFDAGSITSMLDPDSGLPSVDIFVASFAADGTPQWLKQGTAKYADRGMAVTHDPDGNVYVTGQFSDTLTFDVTHPNMMFSAIFLARFGPGGDEQWFRIFGGATYNQVFAITVVEGSRLMITGDLQGSVIFLDSQPDLFTAQEPRSSFLVEVGLDGEFVRQTTWGSQHVVNTRALSVKDNEVAVFGRFQCQFTGFSALSGDGTWLATGHHDLYVARFDLDELMLKDAHQFGGQRNKVPGGMGHLPDGQVVFAGSFDHLLVFPSSSASSFSTLPPVNTVMVPYVPTPFCDDDLYNGYTGLRGISLMDAFIAKGFVEGRQPYDIFVRDPGACDRPQRDMHIRLNGLGVTGPDSLSACHEAELDAYTHTAFTADTTQRHTAPHFHFEWNTGDTTAMITVYSSGWYHVTVTSQAGCWLRNDSLYVTIHPLPAPPLVSDDVVVNTANPNPQNITVCEPEQPWLWATGIDPAHSVEWSGPPGSVQNDSIQATLSGLYGVQVTTPFGCTRGTILLVTLLPNIPLPPLDATMLFSFPQDTDHDDTVRICMNDPLQLSAAFQVFLGGQSYQLPNGLKPMMRLNNGSWSNIQNSWPIISWQQFITEEGWYVYDIDLLITNAPCGEDTLFYGFPPDSIHVIPYPVISPTIVLSGPALICPGDSATITLNCINCTSWDWSGPNIVSNMQDQVVVNGPGNYQVFAQQVDTNGCVTNASSYHTIQWNPNPLLGVIPVDGIICPDSVAVIYTTAQGSNFQWYGPFGPLNVDNDTITTSQQGLYYLEMVDQLGCPVTSDVVLLTDFATPYLNVLPDNVLCGPGETATLQVVTTGQSSLQWWEPFSGNALQQVVDQPGVYTCSVNACGITHVLSVEIFGNNANAQLADQGPFTLCPDDQLVLSAPTGNAVNYWLPGPVFGQQFTVPGAGTYTLVAVDPNGCQDETDVLVDVIEWTEAMSVADTTVCAGTPVTLSATGSGIITWYANPEMTIALGIGPSFDLGVPSESVTLYAQQVEGACASAALAVVATVSDPPAPPPITGPTEVCAGAPVVLTVDGTPGTLFTWTTPTGTITGPEVTLTDVDLYDAGWYTVSAAVGPCITDGVGHQLTVFIPAALSIGPDTLICPGGVALFQVPDGFGSALWHDGTSGATEHFATGSGMVWVQALDSNACTVADTAIVEVFAFTEPLSTTGASICYGASAELLANGSGAILWYADASLGEEVHSGNAWWIDQPTAGAIYHVVQTEGPCTSAAATVLLEVLPTPMDAQVVAPAEVCAGSALELAVSGSDQPSATWYTPVGIFSGPMLMFPAVTLDHAGPYTVVPAVGPCIGDTLMTTVLVLVPQAPDLGPDTTFCEGGWTLLDVPPGYTDPQWSTGSQAWSITVDQPATYGLWAIDPQGCSAFGDVTLATIPCDPDLPNVITPNGDGLNDSWTIDPGLVRSALFTVYNRWGSVVWEGDPSRTGFAGRHFRTGEVLGDGTYFYVLHLSRTDGSTADHSGYLSVTR